MASHLIAISDVDLNNCDREPIQIPGSIQPHGMLFALNTTNFTILQVSENIDQFLPHQPEALLGASFERVIGVDNLALLAQKSQTTRINEVMPLQLRVQDTVYNTISHRPHNNPDTLIVELEPVMTGESLTTFDFYHKLRGSRNKYSKTEALLDYLDQITADLKAITGFDRVMLYRFDADFNGEVLIEHREPTMASYLGLWFPHTDIPKQARELYRSNTLRLIADTSFNKAALVPQINPHNQGPLDLSYSVLRSVSPIHLEYLQNMEVGASMSISLLTATGDLWGLICFHHPVVRQVPYPLRALCELYGQIVSSQIGNEEKRMTAQQNMAGHEALLEIFEDFNSDSLGETSLIEALLKQKSGILELFGATGAMVCLDGNVQAFANLPLDDSGVTSVLHRLMAAAGRELEREPGQNVYASSYLQGLLSDAAQVADYASGMLFISLSETHQDYIAFFRPEFVQTLTWAGQPDKGYVVEKSGEVTLHPRQSFQSWQQEVRGVSKPWSESQQFVAEKFRGLLLERQQILDRERAAESLKKLNAELRVSNMDLENFASIASHDLKTPLRKITMFTKRMRESRAMTDDQGVSYIDRIDDSIGRMNVLINDLLSFSRIKNVPVSLVPVDLEEPVRESIDTLETLIQETGGEVHISTLPSVLADKTLLLQLFTNLISNGLKYHRPDVKPVIRVYTDIDCEEGHCRVVVEDNGIGFDAKYTDYIFNMFKRLHSREEYEGTGVGLAICRRIAEHFGGSIAAESEVGKGSRFIITLPGISDED